MLSRRRFGRAFLGALLLVGSGVAFAAACDDNDSESVGPVTPASVVVNGAAIDVHVHLVSAELAALLGAQGAATADDLIARMDEAHVRRAVVLSAAYMSVLADDAAMRAENDFAAAEVARYPDRLIGFCGINPLRGSALPEVDRCVDQLGMRGLKLHLVGSQVDVTNAEHLAALARVFDRAGQLGLPILIHIANPIGLPLDSDGLTNLGTIIATHPDVRVGFAHCFSLLDNQQLDLLTAGIRQRLLRGDSLFLDLSACLSGFQDAPPSERALMVWRLRKFGLERVFFGSDYIRIDPNADTPEAALKALAAYPFTQQEIDMILSNDAAAWLEGR